MGAEVLTVDEPDGGHGDGEEGPRAHVHLHQCCCQGKEQQDAQQAAQNAHYLRDAARKKVESIRWAPARQGVVGKRCCQGQGSGAGRARQVEQGKDGRSSWAQMPWQGLGPHHWYRKELRRVKSSRGSWDSSVTQLLKLKVSVGPVWLVLRVPAVLLASASRP